MTVMNPDFLPVMGGTRPHRARRQSRGVETLTTKKLAGVWGITERASRELTGKLEGLGFKLERDLFGGRRVPVELVDAVSRVRDANKPLEAVLSDPTVTKFRQGRTDALGAVIEARAELELVRGVLLCVIQGLENDGRASIAPSGGWAFAGLLDPKGAF